MHFCAYGFALMEIAGLWIQKTMAVDYTLNMTGQGRRI